MLPILRTEEEMKQLWCPWAMSHTYHVAPTSTNRTCDGMAAVECRCLGTGCAAFLHCRNLRNKAVGYCGLMNVSGGLPQNAKEATDVDL